MGYNPIQSSLPNKKCSALHWLEFPIITVITIHHHYDVVSRVIKELKMWDRFQFNLSRQIKNGTPCIVGVSYHHHHHDVIPRIITFECSIIAIIAITTIILILILFLPNNKWKALHCWFGHLIITRKKHSGGSGLV